MRFTAGFIALAGTAVAHCKHSFPSDTHNFIYHKPLTQPRHHPPRRFWTHSSTSNWQFVRRTENYQSNGPVTDVASASMTCYELEPGTPAPETLPVKAGDTVTFQINPNIYHPGPVNVYMAKAPGTAADFDGKGSVWFKIYGDEAIITESSIDFPSDGKCNTCCNKNSTMLTLSRRRFCRRCYSVLHRERRVPHPLQANRSSQRQCCQRGSTLPFLHPGQRHGRLGLLQPQLAVFPRRVLGPGPRPAHQHLLAHPHRVHLSWRPGHAVLSE